MFKAQVFYFFSPFFTIQFLFYLFRDVKKFDFFNDVFECVDGEKGLALAPFLSKFSSVKMVGKKGSVPIIDYKQIEKATGNFKESNILGEGGFGCVYKARLDDNLDVAIKKMNCENQYAEKEFEVIMPANNLLIFFVGLNEMIHKHHAHTVSHAHTWGACILMLLKLSMQSEVGDLIFMLFSNKLY